MSETRVYEVEHWADGAWRLKGNIDVKDYSIVNSLVDRADRDDWPDGEYRLLHWDENFASGSFFLVTLRSEKHRRGEMHKPAEREEAAA